jgi:hypothetical protein
MTEANIVTGLAGIRKFKEEQDAKREAMNRPKAEWFSWPKGVSTATVRFLQELDADATNYDSEMGLGIIAVEHQAPGPEGFKRRGLCTKDSEGECYACERHAARVEEDKGGWRQRTNLYINALVDFGNGEKKVLVISRNFNASFTQALIEEAIDEQSIVDANFKITKTGEGTTTQWLLKRLKSEPFSTDGVEVFDLNETAVRKIDYDKQPEYYGAVYQNSDAPAAPQSAPDEDTW